VNNTVTNESISLIELTEKHANADFMREMGEWALHRLMELEVESQIGAGRHERSDERSAHRNGYRERSLETRVGTMNLKIPKLRSGSYYPSFLEPRRRSEQALVAVIQEAYVKGVSTRKVDDLVQSMGMSGISKSQVSRFCAELDGKVKKFLGRLIDGQWPYIWLDATYLKSREDGHVTSRAVVVATGVNSEGRRDILGLSVGPGESEAFWTEFLRSLKDRGLDGVKLVISDAHKGLRNAIDTVMCATWQRCRVHFMRNALAHVPKNQHQMVASIIRTAFDQPTQGEASTQWRGVADQLRGKFRKLGELMDSAEEEVLAFMSFPTEHRRQIASTNNLERLNKEIKRRSNVVGIFPNDDAVKRLIGALAMEQSEEWHLTRRYMSQESLNKVLHGDSTPAALEEITKEQVA
jgi:transposase-like protein